MDAVDPVRAADARRRRSSCCAASAGSSTSTRTSPTASSTVTETKQLGGSGLHPRGGDGSLEIGYWVAADAIGQGIATESTAVLTRVGIELCELERDRHPGRAAQRTQPRDPAQARVHAGRRPAPPPRTGRRRRPAPRLGALHDACARSSQARRAWSTTTSPTTWPATGSAPERRSYAAGMML